MLSMIDIFPLYVGIMVGMKPEEVPIGIPLMELSSRSGVNEAMEIPKSKMGMFG
jgi:hypothetical protein